MNQRFQPEEIKRVSEQNAGNELYLSIRSIGPQLESEDNFGLCAEECFTEVVELLSAVADRGEGILADIENIWFKKFNDYRRFDRHINEDDVRRAVGIVLGFTILALDSSRHSFYRYTLAKRLTQVVAGHQFDGWTTTLERIFSVPLPDGWFDGFIEEDTKQEVGKSDGKTPQTLEQVLSQYVVLNTKRARTYFQKAIDKGWMKLEEGKLSWIPICKLGGKSQLAYFLGRVYGYENSARGGNIGNQIPEKELCALFGDMKIHNLLDQIYQAKSKQKWRSAIDEIF